MSVAEAVLRLRKWNLLVLVLLLVALQACLLPLPHGPAMVLVFKLLLLAADVLVVIAVVRAFQRATGFGRMFWGLCTIGFSVLTLGVLLVAYNNFPGNLRIVPWWLVLDFTGALNAFLIMCLLVDPAADGEKSDWLRIFDFAQVGIVYFILQLYLANLQDNVKTYQLGGVVEVLITAGFAVRAFTTDAVPVRRLFLWFAAFRFANTLTNFLVVAKFSTDLNSGWLDLLWTGMLLFPIAAAITWTNPLQRLSAPKLRSPYERLLVSQIVPLIFPILLLVMAANVARMQLQLAAGATFISISIYYLRLLLTQRRQRQGEQALSESHALLRGIIDGCNEAIFVKDLEGRYLMSNTANAAWHGQTVQNLIGKTDAEFFPPETARIIEDYDRKVIQTGLPITYEQSLSRGDEVRSYIIHKSPRKDADGNINGLIVVAFDNTEIRNYEQRLSTQSRLEAIGTLSGGIAHDFNNLLTIILGYNSLILDGKDDPQSAAEQINAAANRAATLVRQLLAFSRRQILQPQILSLKTVLLNLNKMLQRLIGEDIELITSTKEDIGLVKADPGQIEQVIMNLAANARDAMPHGGKLTLELDNVFLDETYTREHAEIVPGPYVMLAVSDTGEGMAAPILSRIFEPFFTTKSIDRGTGLGLATVYGILKQSGGSISVYSELNKGTTFKIYLPRVEEAVQTSPFQTGGVGNRLRGSETVLVVEDDNQIRRLACAALAEFGYSVLEASDPMQGISTSALHAGMIDLLITDVVMPGMGVRELMTRIAAHRPHIKVLYMSGYTSNAIVHHGVLDPGTFFLQKPFTPTSLAEKVREVLDSPSQAQSAAMGAS